MEYFAGLDVSLEKTHVCVLDRNATVVFESAVVSSPGAILSGTDDQSALHAGLPRPWRLQTPPVPIQIFT